MEATNNQGSCVQLYLIAENRLLRESLVRLFQKRAGISVVAERRFCDAAAQQVARSQCDVLLLDSLATSAALDLLEDMREEAPQIKVVLFGMDENAGGFLQAVHLGVRGYLLKDASSAEVIAAVEGVMRGEAICPPQLCASLFDFVTQELRRKPRLADHEVRTALRLTHRQRQLLNLVAKGFTNKEIALNLNLSEFTVKNHISRIMKQVDAASRYEAIELVRASGLRLNA